MSKPSIWHFEFYTRDGDLLADLTGRANERSIEQSRNIACSVIAKFDLAEIEAYAAASKIDDPNSIIIPGSTEVRVRRGTKYLEGAQISYRRIIIKDTAKVEIRASGFLSLFGDRFTDEERFFAATQATSIAATLITETQAGHVDNNFGVTIGTLATVGAHDKTFKAVRIDEAIKRSAELFDFDFEFTHDKVFNTYAAIGSRRPDITFKYPGNILSIDSPLDATNIKNRVYVLGSGSGSGGGSNVKVQRDSAVSQTDYKVREERLNYSDVEDEDDLANHGDVELDAWSVPFEIPTITVDGKVAPFVTDYGIGDYVKVECNVFGMLRGINGFFRVERRVIKLDKDDNETVTLYLSR